MSSLALLSLLAVVAPANALDATVVEAAKRGTVLLRTDTGEGSGFFATDREVMTNAHVVKDAGVGALIDIVLDSGTRGDHTIPGVVAHIDAECDLAIVLVSSQPGRALAIEPAPPTETQDVVAVGFPLGSLRAFGVGQSDPPVSLRPGAVTALHIDSGGGLSLIEHNANMQQGNSGGPLIDGRGRVIGVNEAFLVGDTTTKLAIPGAIAAAYLRRATSEIDAVLSAPVAQGEPPAASPSNEFARPFTEGLVREAVVGGGELYVLLTTGIVLRWSEQGWASTRSGQNNGDLAVDDTTGAVYVVESDTGNLYRLEGDTWRMEGDGKNRVIGASGGWLWAAMADNSLMVRAPGGEWSSAGLTGVQDIAACSEFALLRAGTKVWMHDGTQLANEGEPLREDVRSIACERDHVYSVMTDGTIRDLIDQRTIDTNTDNVGVYALPGGALARTRSGALWFWSRDDEGWTRLGD